MRDWPIKKINTNATMILIDAVVKATNKSEGFFPSDGNKIKRKTTAKSWDGNPSIHSKAC